jgi:hypothetical protein
MAYGLPLDATGDAPERWTTRSTMVAKHNGGRTDRRTPVWNLQGINDEAPCKECAKDARGPLRIRSGTQFPARADGSRGPLFAMSAF